MFKGLSFVRTLSQDSYIYWLQTQIHVIYEALVAHNIIETGVSVMNKGGTGAMLWGLASKFGRTDNFLKSVGTTFPKAAETLNKIVKLLQSVADTLNKYDSILQPFKNIWNNYRGYQQIVSESLELAEVEGSWIDNDVIKCICDVTSCSNISGNGCISLRDLQDILIKGLCYFII